MIEVAGPVAWILYACMTGMTLSIGLAFLRLLLGPSMPDRIIALDLIAYQAIALMVAYGVLTDQPNFLEVALVLALIAFLGTIAFSLYIKHASVSDPLQS